MNAKFFMEYLAEDSSTQSGWKSLGSENLLELPEGRQTCAAGQAPFLLTSDKDLDRGHRVVTVKASPAKPVKGVTIIYPLGGKREWRHPLDPPEQ
jgi:hypothetical protein